jgi:sugar O-acyltransferase (sialic acid O-acetyltransferase NeuD family)
VSEINNKILLTIIGAGGHCTSLIDVIECIETFELKGIIAEGVEVGKNTNGYPVIGNDKDFKRFQELGFAFAIGIGQIKSHFLRKSIFDQLVNITALLPNIISPYARVSPRSQLGIGNSIMHDVVINANVSVGDNCIINSKALVEHDAIIGSNTHIATGSIINGDVKVGDNCFIGSGAVIANGINICNNVIIGAGAVVVRDIDIPGVYVGNPLSCLYKI